MAGHNFTAVRVHGRKGWVGGLDRESEGQAGQDPVKIRQGARWREDLRRWIGGWM